MRPLVLRLRNPLSHIAIKWKVKSLSRVRLFATPWTVAYQAPPSMGFFRQEYWSGLPFPSPGDLPSPGIKPRFPRIGDLDSNPGLSKKHFCNSPVYIPAHLHLPGMDLWAKEQISTEIRSPFPQPTSPVCWSPPPMGFGWSYSGPLSITVKAGPWEVCPGNRCRQRSQFGGGFHQYEFLCWWSLGIKTIPYGLPL